MEQSNESNKIQDIPFVVKVRLESKSQRGHASYLVIAKDNKDAKEFMNRKLAESKMVKEGIRFAITSCLRLSVDQMLISDIIK